MSGPSALIFGSTGAVGKPLLREVLSSGKFSRVGEYGRHVTPTADLPGTEKLEQKIIDFENLDTAAIKSGNWDVIYITLGTNSREAGSPEKFEKIDRQYVLDAARAAKSDNPEHKQRVVYLSSVGANSSSTFVYPRSKGLTEEGLASMGYELIAFRPGWLAQADRGNRVRPTSEMLIKPFFSLLSYVTSAAQIPVTTLAKSMRKAGELGAAGIPASMKTEESHKGLSFPVINNGQAHKLASFEQ